MMPRDPHAEIDGAHIAAKPRNRRREGAGKSESSHIKQRFARKAVRSQVFAYRRANPLHRIVLIDGNAGDGVGVPIPQFDLFEGEIVSHPTPEILTQIANRLVGVDVILCERKKDRREELKARFPHAIILSDNKDALAHIRADHCYALWLSDPNGPSTHGVETMRALADNPRIRSDFVVIFNEGSAIRMGATDDPLWEKHRERYPQMAAPLWWAEKLRKNSVAYSKLIGQSANFRFRLLIVANHLGDVARGKDFTVARAKPRLAGEG